MTDYHSKQQLENQQDQLLHNHQRALRNIDDCTYRARIALQRVASKEDQQITYQRIQRESQQLCDDLTHEWQVNHRDIDAKIDELAQERRRHVER